MKDDSQKPSRTLGKSQTSQPEETAPLPLTRDLTTAEGEAQAGSATPARVGSSAPPAGSAPKGVSHRRSRRVLNSNPTGRTSSAVDPFSATQESPARQAAPRPRRPIPQDLKRWREEEPKADANSWLKKLLWALLAISAFGAIAGGITVYLVVDHYSQDLPSVKALKAGYRPPQITRIYARDQTLLSSIFTERRTVVPFDQVPDSAKLAFLAAEDAHFYEHEGLNYFGIARAFVVNFRAGRTVQGGSTITQQVVKNVLLDSSRTLSRKIKELLLARRLEQSLSKDEILWLYMNHIYLGHGRYGIEEAARYYFGKHAKDLGLDESSVLAGLVAAPERFSPRKDPERALARRRYVLGQMKQKGFVTPELYEQVLKRPLRLAPAAESESKLAPEVTARVTALLKEIAPHHEASGGFSVTTTIDPELQAQARRALRKNLDAYMERHKLVPPYTSKANKLWGEPFEGTPKPFKIYTGVVERTDDLAGTIDVRVGDTLGRVALSSESRYNPQHLPPSDFTKPGAVLRVSLPEAPDANEEPGERSKPALRLELGPQSALVAFDARSREVLAMVGSYEAIAGGLDRASHARRQPGSSFKPIVYSYALHSRHYTPATPIPVEKRGHGVPEEGPLQISVRQALAHSNNEAAVSILKSVGAENVVQWAKALGIHSAIKPDLSLALGAYEVTPLELANVYVGFANGGMAGEPVFTKQVLGASGQSLELPPQPPPRRVLEAAEAYLTTSLMQSVIKDGTGRAALKLGRPVAGKTGTTNQSKDAWFIGYTTDIVAAVWVGFDDARPLGKRESGARTALPAWIDFMEAAHRDKPKTRFVRPPGVLSLRVDAQTGLLPRPGQSDGLIEEEFLAGTEPERSAPLQTDAGVPVTEQEPPQPARPQAPDEAPPF